MNDLFVMNMKRKILFVCLSFLALLQGWAQHTWQAGPVNLELIQQGQFEVPFRFLRFLIEKSFYLVWFGYSDRGRWKVLFILFRYEIRTEVP